MVGYSLLFLQVTALTWTREIIPGATEIFRINSWTGVGTWLRTAFPNTVVILRLLRSKIVHRRKNVRAYCSWRWMTCRVRSGDLFRARFQTRSSPFTTPHQSSIFHSPTAPPSNTSALTKARKYFSRSWDPALAFSRLSLHTS